MLHQSPEAHNHMRYNRNNVYVGKLKRMTPALDTRVLKILIHVFLYEVINLGMLGFINHNVPTDRLLKKGLIRNPPRLRSMVGGLRVIFLNLPMYQ